MGKDVLDTSIFEHHEDLLFRKEAKNKVSVINVRDNSLYEIDEIAAEVFLSLDGRRDVGSIRRALRDRCGIPDSSFNRDFDLFIKDLRKNGLITKKN